MRDTFCVIMAGGIGSRFWPLSRTSRPKQFLDILGTGQTLIQQTFNRLKKIAPASNFLVVTNVEYKDMVLAQLPELNEDQVLCEPMRRNTAPCIAYAAYKIKKKNPDANMIVAPSDHLITMEDTFIEQLNHALSFVNQNDALVTLGITPSRPETGYGYIQVNKKVDFADVNNLYKVKTFTEKPDLKMAKVFMESGEFFWNSGIFIWSLKSILKAFGEILPEVDDAFKKGEMQYYTSDEHAFLNKTYSECQNISIDYGIMEKAHNVYVFCANFGWSDLGTWGSMWENYDKDDAGNAVNSDMVSLYDVKGCIVNMPKDKLVILQGLEDYIVVESDNALLVCKKESEQHIRQFVNDVQMSKGDKFI